MSERDEQDISRIRFIYQKARHHRTLHADGVWASVTPQMEIQCAFFNNLKQMPDEETHIVSADGVLSSPISNTALQAVLRETEITIVLNTEVAKSLIDLLHRMVSQADEHLKKLREAQSVTSGSGNASEAT